MRLRRSLIPGDARVTNTDGTSSPEKLVNNVILSQYARSRMSAAPFMLYCEMEGLVCHSTYLKEFWNF